jgi:hypothetical protein
VPKLTVPTIKTYKPGAARREIRDTLAPGLHLVIQPKPTGTRSWALRFRRPDGRPAKLTLGRVDLSEKETPDAPVVGGVLTLRQARELANQIDRQRALGLDVVEEHQTKRQRQRAAAIDRATNTLPRLSAIGPKRTFDRRHARRSGTTIASGDVWLCRAS